MIILFLCFKKELGDKILGNYLSKNYGRLSILSNYRLNNIDRFTVSPNCFFPKPKITSIVINFKPKQKNTINIKDLQNLEKITNIFFSKKEND